MKINVNNKDKIEARLDDVNRGAVEHTADYYDITTAAKDAERRLDAFGVVQRDRVGAIIEVQSGVTLRGSYRYRVNRTNFTLLRGTNAWYLTDARRVAAYPTKPSWSGNIKLPQATIEKAVLSKGIVRQ